jgi:hypothetical protein
LAIDCTPLLEALHAADETGDVSELLKIRRNMEIRKYLAIVEVEERPDFPASELAVAEISKEERIMVMTTETGLTLEDVVDGQDERSATGSCGSSMHANAKQVLAITARERFIRGSPMRNQGRGGVPKSSSARFCAASFFAPSDAERRSSSSAF